MRSALLPCAVAALFVLAFHPHTSFAQKPAPVENVSTFEARTPADEQKALHVPPGFEVQLVAAEPQIHKPMNIAFDDRGRLWVTDTLEYPFPAEKGKRPRDSVKILEDFGPDGKARKITTFADGLNIPIGIIPLPDCNSALVHAIPKVFRMTDTDGDGRADQVAPAYESIGFRDTHGMTNAFTWGFDGWIYACHGFANDSSLQGSDKKPITLNSGNVYRMRPDGSHVEYYSHGQVNPFGLAFDPLGNLYSSDCHSKPVYQLLRGAYYPSFGKPDDGLGFGPEMVTHDHGSTAIAGIVSYAADNFPPEYLGRIFIGNVVTNRINQDKIEWHGASPKGIEQPDFVWSEDNWFRPVDLELGPDGALYVADFYNRIIGHYEVPLTHPGRDRERGRIWRIVYRGSDGKTEAKAPRADWTKATTAELIEDLGHPNLTVRMRAANQLTRREPYPPLLTSVATEKNPLKKIQALWVLERWGILTEDAIAEAARDSHAEVRVHAMRILGELAEMPSTRRELALRGLRDSDATVKRAAADALGRHPDNANIRPLLALRQAVPADDTHLLHVVRMALRDQLLANAAWTYLQGLRLNNHSLRNIADVANGVPTAPASAFLLEQIQQSELPQDVTVRYVHHIARNGDKASVSALLGVARKRAPAGIDTQVELVRAIQQGSQERGAKLSQETRSLAQGLAATLLGSSKNHEISKGINLASTFPIPELRGRLETMALDPKVAEPQRAEALAALMSIDPDKSLRPLAKVLNDSAEVLGMRERAAAVLGSVDRSEAQAELVKVLPTAPERLQTMIASVLAQRKGGAEALLETIKVGKASARLLQESRVANPLANSGARDVKDQIAALLKGLPAADQKLNELLRRRRTAYSAAAHDAKLGAAVYEKNCAACHQLAGKGAKIGPQLDGVGARGSDRLFEDILDPSRNVDQTFRVTNLALKDGQTVSGLLLREEGEVLVLADAQGKEVRIPRDTVEERAVAPLSPMPANFNEQINEKDLSYLIDYLLSHKVGGETNAK